MDKYIETPLTKEKVKELHAGDYVYITGTVYTARDAAHKRMVEQKEQGMELPFIMKDQTIYYLGGAGALLSKCIKKSEVIAYDDLGTEAIRKLYVENLPVITVIDCDGNNLYETAPEKYKRSH